MKDGIVDGYGWTGYEVKRRKAVLDYKWARERAPTLGRRCSSKRLGKGCKGSGWEGRSKEAKGAKDVK